MDLIDFLEKYNIINLKYVVICTIIQFVALITLLTYSHTLKNIKYFPPYISDLAADQNIGPYFIGIGYFASLFGFSVLRYRYLQMRISDINPSFYISTYFIGVLSFTLNLIVLFFPVTVYSHIHFFLAVPFFLIATTFIVLNLAFLMKIETTSVEKWRSKLLSSAICFRLILSNLTLIMVIVQLIILCLYLTTNSWRVENKEISPDISLLYSLSTSLEWAHAFAFSFSTLLFLIEFLPIFPIERIHHDVWSQKENKIMLIILGKHGPFYAFLCALCRIMACLTLYISWSFYKTQLGLENNYASINMLAAIPKIHPWYITLVYISTLSLLSVVNANVKMLMKHIYNDEYTMSIGFMQTFGYLGTTTNFLTYLFFVTVHQDLHYILRVAYYTTILIYINWQTKLRFSPRMNKFYWIKYSRIFFILVSISIIITTAIHLIICLERIHSEKLFEFLDANLINGIFIYTEWIHAFILTFVYIVMGIELIKVSN